MTSRPCGLFSGSVKSSIRKSVPSETLCAEKIQRGFNDIHGLNFDDGFRKGMHTPFTRATRKVAAALFPTFTLFSIPHSLQNQARSLLGTMQQFPGAEFVQTRLYSLDAVVSGLHLLKEGR